MIKYIAVVAVVAVVVVAVVGLAGSAYAQSLQPQIDKRPLLLEGTSVWPYELDGAANTPEWIAMKRTEQDGETWFQAVRLCNGQIVRGPWFSPVQEYIRRVPVVEFTLLSLMRVQGVDQIVFQGARYYQVMRVDLPGC